jgi:hypothetical protein
MCRGVLANDIDYSGLSLAGIMQVRDAVAKTGGQVQQRGGRLVSNAKVAVSRPSNHSFEQSQYRTHTANLVERVDEMHLGGPEKLAKEFSISAPACFRNDTSASGDAAK